MSCRSAEYGSVCLCNFNMIRLIEIPSYIQLWNLCIMHRAFIAKYLHSNEICVWHTVYGSIHSCVRLCFFFYLNHLLHITPMAYVDLKGIFEMKSANWKKPPTSGKKKHFMLFSTFYWITTYCNTFIFIVKQAAFSMDPSTLGTTYSITISNQKLSFMTLQNESHDIRKRNNIHLTIKWYRTFIMSLDTSNCPTLSVDVCAFWLVIFGKWIGGGKHNNRCCCISLFDASL